MAAVLVLAMMVLTPARHTTAAALARPVQARPLAPAIRLSSVRHGKLRLVLSICLHIWFLIVSCSCVVGHHLREGRWMDYVDLEG